jgi:hypothetical protein
MTSRWLWLEQVAQDLRYGCRTLAHTPAFAATTILTLAIGLALTTGVFTVFNAYVLRTFAVRDPAGLYQVIWHARDAIGRNLRWRDYEAIRDRRDLFTDAIAESTRYVSFKGRPLAAELVSDNYFATLGPDMFLGRPLGPADEAGNAVVISHTAWRRPLRPRRIRDRARDRSERTPLASSSACSAPVRGAARDAARHLDPARGLRRRRRAGSRRR